MTYEIHTFGNGEILKSIFDSIAMCLNGQTGTLFEPLKRLGLILGVFWASIYAIYGDQMKVFTNWIIPMTLIMNLLFVPTTSIWIHDPITHYHQKVDNVPYGLAAFSGYVSKLGFVITEQIEKVFSLPDDLKYQKSGSLFAGNIIQQAKTFHITNEDLAENMRSFVGQCVIYTAMMGYKYTIEDLKHSDDIWGLISANASPVRSFMWRDLRSDGSPRNRSQITLCSEGVKKFNAHWGTEMDRASTIYGKKIFGKNSLISAKVELMKYLPLSYSVLGDMSKSATDILKQQMMMYALIDGVETQSTALGNAPNFAARRAHLQQRSTYETLGAMAGDMLPTMKAVLEAIAYACFLFVIPMSLLPFGYRFLLSWAQILLWLQMWAPLYAILNFIMTMASRSKTTAILSMSSEAGVTIASSVGITNLNADMAAMSGYLAMSIPFLCVALVKGVGSFVHMASHLGNVSQSAAGSAASEITSGNFNYGNISEDNVQISNSGMMNQSRASSYKAGSFAMQDGRSEITTMADGTHVVNVGTSKIPTNVRMSESINAAATQMSQNSTRMGMNLSESSSQSVSSSMRSAVQLSDHIAKTETSGVSSNYGITTEQSRAINDGANLVKDFAKAHHIDNDKAAHMLANASMGGGKIFGIGGSLGAGGQISAQDKEAYSHAEKYAQDKGVQNTMREAAHAAQLISHNATDDQTRRLASDVSGSFEQGMQQRSEAQKSFTKARDYSQQASYARSHSASIDSDHAQPFFEFVAGQQNGMVKGPMGYQAAGAELSRPERAEMYARSYIEQNKLMSSMGYSQGSGGFDVSGSDSFSPMESSRQNERSYEHSSSMDSSLESSSQNHSQPIMTQKGSGTPSESASFMSHQPESNNRQIQSHESASERPIQESTQSQELWREYEADTSHQQYAVTKDDLNTVKQQAGDLASHKVDDLAVHQVKQEQRIHKASIRQDVAALKESGQGVQTQVQDQAKKGVTKRVGERGIREAMDLIPGKSGEPQQK